MYEIYNQNFYDKCQVSDKKFEAAKLLEVKANFCYLMIMLILLFKLKVS